MSRGAAWVAAGLAVAAAGVAGVVALRGPAPVTVTTPGADGEQIPAPPRTACEPQGLPPCAKVGLQYASDRASVLDATRAAERLRTGCEAGGASECVSFAVTLWTGRDVEPDRDAAIALLRDACEVKHHATGCLDLGVLYDMGEIESPRRSREDAAFDLYAKACRLGDGLGCSNQGVVAAESTQPLRRADAGPILESACQSGWSIACHNLGILLLSVPGKQGHARAALELACDTGVPYAPACTARGLLAERGSEDPRRWFALGCERGDPAACDRSR